MAWGMLSPKTFGQFWPFVDYIGWDERLTEYYEREMTDSERAIFEDGNGNGVRRYRYYAAEKLVRETGTQLESFPKFTDPLPHEVPRLGRTDRRYNKLGALFKIRNRVIVVDERLKHLIELVDVDRHQFFPFTLETKDGNKYDRSYYIVRFRDYRNSIDVERSTTVLGIESEELYTLPSTSIRDLRGVALQKEHIKGAHFWLERCFKRNVICLSDELYEKIVEADLRIPKCVKMMEVE